MVIYSAILDPLSPLRLRKNKKKLDPSDITMVFLTPHYVVVLARFATLHICSTTTLGYSIHIPINKSLAATKDNSIN